MTCAGVLVGFFYLCERRCARAVTTIIGCDVRVVTKRCVLVVFDDFPAFATHTPFWAIFVVYEMLIALSLLIFQLRFCGDELRCWDLL